MDYSELKEMFKELEIDKVLRSGDGIALHFDIEIKTAVEKDEDKENH